MNVSLTPELERRISEKVESGLYTTASEVVREGLRLLFAKPESREQILERLRADIAIGLEQADRGELISGDQAREILRTKIGAKRREQ